MTNTSTERAYPVSGATNPLHSIFHSNINPSNSSYKQNNTFLDFNGGLGTQGYYSICQKEGKEKVSNKKKGENSSQCNITTCLPHKAPSLHIFLSCNNSISISRKLILHLLIHYYISNKTIIKFFNKLV